jgi:hypothetical protein
MVHAWIPAFAGMTSIAALTCHPRKGSLALDKIRQRRVRRLPFPRRRESTNHAMSREYYVYILASG